jgi:hypothetical protein
MLDNGAQLGITKSAQSLFLSSFRIKLQDAGRRAGVISSQFVNQRSPKLCQAPCHVRYEPCDRVADGV